MLLLWTKDASYWQIGLAYVFIGIGVGLAGTPASHSLTGSVPVVREGMASGTADLQRDLGGALLTSIFGALLAAGYASAMSSAIASSPQAQSVTDSTQSQLQLSYASAANLAAQNPQYSSEILAAAKTSFLQGDDWAYAAALVAIILGAALVFLRFPKRDEEQRLLAAYHAADTS
jgi:protein-S-isoprenylcysteine O-methyltransferase Ste14